MIIPKSPLIWAAYYRITALILLRLAGRAYVLHYWCLSCQLSHHQYVYEHRMGVKPGGNIALLAVRVRWALALSITPLTVAYNLTGGGGRYRRQTPGAGAEAAPVDLAASKGIELVYVNTKGIAIRSRRCGR